MTEAMEWLEAQRDCDKNDTVEKRHIAVILEWCRSKGIKVMVSACAEPAYYFQTKTIVIDSRLRPWRRFAATLLHECGHAMISWRKTDEFDTGYNARETRTKSHRIFVLVEEVEAWRSGRKLCRKLGVPISKADYEREMSGALSRYCSWVVSPSSFAKFTGSSKK